MNRISKKLKSNIGESMAETLISLLIAALGVLLLAGMIQASSNMIVSSNEKFREYVAGENELIEKETVGINGQASLTDSLNNSINFNREDPQPYIAIEYFEKTLGGRKIISFKKK